MSRVSDEYINRLIDLSESQCLSKYSSSEINTDQLLKILYELKYRRSQDNRSSNLFGKKCLVATGTNSKLLTYRIISSDDVSNFYIDLPIMANSKSVVHDSIESVLIIINDSFIDENSILLTVARKDVEILK